MQRVSVIILCTAFGASFLFAEDKATDDCTAPDSEHQVVLQTDNGKTEYTLAICETGSPEKVIYSRPAGGYASFDAAVSPANFKCLWSPDSRFVAVFERGTKRTGDTSIYLVRGSGAEEISLPDVTSRVEHHLTAEMRALWIRPEVWLPDHRLILSVEGTQRDEEHGNFRFLLTVRLQAGADRKFAAKIVAFEQDRTIPFSVR